MAASSSNVNNVLALDGTALDNLSSDQTATFGQGWNHILNLRNSGIKTVAVGSQATAFNTLRIRDESVSGTLTLRQGSDLSFSGLTVVDAASGGGSTANFAFDTNGYAMSFASAFTPIVSNTLAATNVYHLTGSGTIVAQRFTLNSGSTTVNVGAGLTLTATSAGVNTLSGSGTIDPTSTFRHIASGSSSLVSTRAVGNVEVASGTLGITTLSAGGQAARATGGTLSLNGSGYTFASALVNGGAITSGTLTSAGLFDMRAGTVSAILAGAGNLAKTTTGTVTLSSANTYAGGSTVTAGRLVVGNAAALGASSGALAVNGGTLDLGGISVAVGPLSGSAGAVITTANAAGTATLTTSVGSGTSIFGGVIQNNGSGLVALTKTGAGVLDLTGVNSYTGATTVSAGTLLVNGQLGNTAVTVGGGATLGGAGSIGGAVTVNGILSPGNSPGVLSVASLVLGGSSTALMEIAGTTAGTQYDQIGLTSGLAYGGTLQLNVSQAFGDNTTFNLFTGFTSFTGNFSSVVSVGSAYGGVTFARIGDVWTSGTAAGNQSLQFDQATGNLVIVPEPGAVALAGIGIVAAGWAIRRRRAR
jgi:autotransporter-associated beta strand protein